MDVSAERVRRNLALFVRFGVVGASGVLVNLVVVLVATAVAPHAEDVFADLPFTRFNVRWYHVISTVAFMVANLWNFQLNRVWTFRSSGHWWREYLPFLAVGLVGQVIGLVLLTLLMHPGSFLALPVDVFDDSNVLRHRFIWAQVIVLGVVTPLSFVLNKLWTFSSVRGMPRHALDAPEADAPAVVVDREGQPRA